MNDEKKLDLIGCGVYMGSRWSKQNTIAELEKIKAEIEEDKKLYSYNEHIQKGHSNCIDIVNSHISELKGENK